MEELTHNRVRRVTLHSGIIGIFMGGPEKRLQEMLNLANDEGESVVFVLPDNWNAVMGILSLIILIVTLGMWTFSPGYLLVTAKAIR